MKIASSENSTYAAGNVQHVVHIITSGFIDISPFPIAGIMLGGILLWGHTEIVKIVWLWVNEVGLCQGLLCDT